MPKNVNSTKAMVEKLTIESNLVVRITELVDF